MRGAGGTSGSGPGSENRSSERGPELWWAASTAVMTRSRSWCLTTVSPHRHLSPQGGWWLRWRKGVFLILGGNAQTHRRGTLEQTWHLVLFKAEDFHSFVVPEDFSATKISQLGEHVWNPSHAWGLQWRLGVFLGPHSGHSAGVGDLFKKPHGGEEARAARICVQTWLFKTLWLNAGSAFTVFPYFLFFLYIFCILTTFLYFVLIQPLIRTFHLIQVLLD